MVKQCSMLKMMTRKVEIILNVFGEFMKEQVVGNLNGTFVITIQELG